MVNLLLGFRITSGAKSYFQIYKHISLFVCLIFQLSRKRKQFRIINPAFETTLLA